MEVIERKLSEITPYENNPRHNEEAVDKVAASLEEFGWQQPIVVDQDGVIIAGHTRLKAAQKLGLKTAPVVVASDLTDEQVRAYRLADNKTAEFAGWDFDALDAELFRIDKIDMERFGFDFEKVKDLDPVEEDDYEEDPESEPRAKLGDFFKLGRHRLLCGDATEAHSIAALMDDIKADVLFTDPPYGMGLDTDYSGMKSKFKGSEGGKQYDAGAVDDFSDEMINSCFAVNAPETFIWGGDYFAELLPDRNDGSWIVWDKRANSDIEDIETDESSDKMFGSCFELCWSRKRHKRDIARVKWAGIFGLEQEPDHKRCHPTQKPVKLAEWFLSRYSKSGDVVVDLFGGSGSTLIACEQMDRVCCMMELDPHYCDVIIGRWEKFTGEKAELING